MRAKFGGGTEAVAIRLDSLGDFAGALRGHRPIVAFVDQGLAAAPLADPAISSVLPGTGLSLGSFGLNRVIFILDRSTSMEDLLYRGATQRKIDYIREKIAGISSSYFPEGTKVSLIYFNDNLAHHDCGSVDAGAISELQGRVSSLLPDGGTKFSEPLAVAARILEQDRADAKLQVLDVEDQGHRSLIFFLTDGQDQDGVLVPEAARKLRDLNATTFVCGVGEQYSVQRILEIASHAGPAGWSHVPLEVGEMDVFDHQIPAIIRQLIAEEHYLKILAQGHFSDFVAVTPSMRDVPIGQQAFLGYQQSAASMLFEKESFDDISLRLQALRHVSDGSPYSHEIDIVDAGDAAYLYERVLEAQSVVDRYLIRQALSKGDVKMLEMMRELNSELAPFLDQAIDDFKKMGPRAYGGGGSQSINTAMTMTSLPQNTTRRPDATVFPGAGDSPHQLSLYSGALGPLSAPVPANIPPVGKINARAYNSVQPAPRWMAACIAFSQPLSVEGSTHKHLNNFSLRDLRSGKSYVFGRKPQTHQGIDTGSVPVSLNGSEKISRTHFKIFEREGRYYIEDLGSLNGTRVSGAALTPKVAVELKEKDQILVAGLGPITFYPPRTY